jgi:hypothetical protein
MKSAWDGTSFCSVFKDKRMTVGIEDSDRTGTAGKLDGARRHEANACNPEPRQQFVEGINPQYDVHMPKVVGTRIRRHLPA